MARHAKFTPKKSPSGWRLNVPAKYSETGARQQLFYRTQADAKAAAATLKEKVEAHGTTAKAIRPSLAEAAIACEKLLEPLGITLLEAVSAFVKRETANRASLPIEAAFTAYLDAHHHWSESHSRATRRRQKILVEAFGGRMLATITGEELRKHIEDTTGGADSFNQAVRLCRAFWRWCANPPRQWCDAEAVAHLEVKTVSHGDVGILTAKEAATLMSAAEKYFPDTVVPFAIALFCGLRQAEIERLRPEDVSAEGVTVPAISSKTKRRRFIAMNEPLKAWLSKYHRNGADVIPSNWSRKEKAVRRLAGWRVWSDLVPTVDPELEAEAPKDAPDWPTNALRHTAATVAVSLGKPLESLVFEHGHSGGVALLKRHYLGVMKPTQAAAIWAIRPNGKKAKTLRIA